MIEPTAPEGLKLAVQRLFESATEDLDPFYSMKLIGLILATVDTAFLIGFVDGGKVATGTPIEDLV
jgi:hypothetical protein